jgi:hypothetical protein
VKESIKTYFQPAFLICVIILLISAAGMTAAQKKFGMVLKKEPLPLKKSLDLLDQNGLGPYKVLSKGKIDNKEVLQSLGTEDYIEWILEDSEVSPDSSAKECMLFITYYPLPDRVPHVPEECYTGGGYQTLSSELLSLKLDDGDHRVSGKPLSQSEVLVKYLVFSGTDPWSSEKFAVSYLFSVNGQYTNSREDTRIALNKNLFGKYSYFSKVEWKFFGAKFGDRVYPNREETAAASKKLLKVILPMLENEHWPMTADVNENKANAVPANKKSFQQ